ncbi:hypothetical protein Q3A66_02210 [Hymenobacter sp. BT770]|uniref:hypothetical protein n=1 Tax=Hymenobacter sp. BT770 TaxID=2886942 RepID=UPI001D1277D5|nr:hypothetical protein [Hymenobacter sp. BT770]MCC3151557.1 hypothetical protein [Hymenobacter sp. BT770]MDO3413866.1 hypothetical protein [Hymenobacter sp. BT770]
MKTTPARLVCLLLSGVLAACGLLGAGSHVYCESVVVAYPSDGIIQRLTALKATGRFDDNRSFPDGPGDEQHAPHYFYFYDLEHQFLVFLDVPRHTPTHTDVHINAIKDFKASSEWHGFNKDVTEAKKAEVLAWFEQVIRPTLACGALPWKPKRDAVSKY